MKTKDIEAIIKDNPHAVFAGATYGTFTIEGFDYITKSRNSMPTKVAITRNVAVYSRDGVDGIYTSEKTSTHTLTQIGDHMCDSAEEMLALHVAAKAKRIAAEKARDQQASMAANTAQELLTAMHDHDIPAKIEVRSEYGTTKISVVLNEEQAAALAQILNQK